MSATTPTPQPNALASVPPELPIVCLCGSSKHPELHMRVMMDETLAGRIVIPMGLYGHADFPSGAKAATNDGDESTAVKQMLDTLHHRKIDVAHEILVVRVDGYIGSSTRREIEYAESKGKTVRYFDTIAQPADAATVQESMDVHLREARAEIAELKLDIESETLAKRLLIEGNAELKATFEARAKILTEQRDAAHRRNQELHLSLTTAEKKARELEEELRQCHEAISAKIQGKSITGYLSVQFPATDGHIPLRDYFTRLGGCLVSTVPPTPTQEQAGGAAQIPNETVGIIPTATTPTKASSDVSALGVEAASRLLPFDLAKALAGAKVVTRDGQVVNGITHDGKDMIDGILNSLLCSWWKTGCRYSDGKSSRFDLFLFPAPGTGADTEGEG